VPITFRNKRCLIIFGEVKNDLEINVYTPLQNGPVLLGFADSWSLETVWQEARIRSKKGIEEIICPNSMLDQVSNAGDLNETRGTPISSVVKPAEIVRFQRLIKKFQLRGYSFERVKLMLMFQDAYRRAEIRTLGEGPFLSNTYRLGVFRANQALPLKKYDKVYYFELCALLDHFE